MVKQATECISTVGVSIRNTSISMQQAGENFQSALTEVKTHARIGRRRRRNGYDGDTEGVPDKRTGPKPNKMLDIHV
jgi:hypothetical protein